MWFSFTHFPHRMLFVARTMCMDGAVISMHFVINAHTLQDLKRNKQKICWLVFLLFYCGSATPPIPTKSTFALIWTRSPKNSSTMIERASCKQATSQPASQRRRERRTESVIHSIVCMAKKLWHSYRNPKVHSYQTPQRQNIS